MYPLLLLLAMAAPAQPAFRVGDAVEASPTYSDAGWQPCLVVEPLEGGSFVVACGPQRTEHVVSAAWIRPVPPAGTLRPALNPGRTTPSQRPPTGVCRPGARVVDRDRRGGTVVQPEGADCHVRLADGTVRRYLTWMLSASKDN